MTMTRQPHKKWTPEEDVDLDQRFLGGAFPPEIAHALGRSELAIRARLAKHKLLPGITADDLEFFSALRAKPLEPILPSSEQNIYPIVEPIPSVDIQQAFHRFHFVYGIVNPRNQVYVGYTQDVWHRVRQHNRNVGAVATKNSGPWFPFSIYCFAAEVDARSMETYIHRNFKEFTERTEISLCEVLSQIGVPFNLAELVRV